MSRKDNEIGIPPQHEIDKKPWYRRRGGSGKSRPNLGPRTSEWQTAVNKVEKILHHNPVCKVPYTGIDAYQEATVQAPSFRGALSERGIPVVTSVRISIQPREVYTLIKKDEKK